MSQARGHRRRRAGLPALAGLAAVLTVSIAAAAPAGVGLESPDAPVADAAMRDDVAAVRALLDGGADVNAAQGDGMTALHWAARNGNAALTELLVAAGSDLESSTRIGAHTPLHVASTAGRGAVVELLLGAGADAGAETTTGATALHFAAAAGDVRSVAALMAHGAPPDAAEPEWGQTPLMFAAAYGRVDAIRALLAGGADPSITARVLDIRERSELDRQDSRDRRARMAANADAERSGAERQDARRPQPGEAGRAPVRRATAETQEAAAARAAYEAQQVDLQEEPEPLGYADLVGVHGGLSALLLAAREGHRDAVFALLDGGAELDRGSAADGTTALLIATINGYFDLAMELLERGADPTRASSAGATPLYGALNMHWAPKARHPQPTVYMQQETSYLELMTALLDAGADVNARLRKTLWYTTYNRDLLGVDRTGATPFWRAAHALDLDAMRLLLAHGADPDLPTLKVPERSFSRDTVDYSGLPPVPLGGPAVYPIHAASGVGHGQGFAGNSHRHVPDGWLPTVRFLVEEFAADVNQRDHNGYTPVHHAAARGDNELIHYLVEQGAVVTAVARNGRTTVDMANGPVQRVQPYPETIALLESLGAKNNHNCVSC